MKGEHPRADRRAAARVVLEPIGIIRSPYCRLEGMPIQPRGALGVKGTVEVFPEFREGLSDLEGFSHLILLYHFHRASAPKLRALPFLDTTERGIFATRSPARPNHIGLSVVRLRSVLDGELEVENIDILDGTPLLDIKPYVPDFDFFDGVSIGWLAATRGSDPERLGAERSDGRFRGAGTEPGTPPAGPAADSRNDEKGDE